MNIAYKHSTAKKSDEQMIIIYSNTVDSHRTVMIIFDTAPITH